MKIFHGRKEMNNAILQQPYLEIQRKEELKAKNKELEKGKTQKTIF